MAIVNNGRERVRVGDHNGSRDDCRGNSVSRGGWECAHELTRHRYFLASNHDSVPHLLARYTWALGSRRSRRLLCHPKYCQQATAAAAFDSTHQRRSLAGSSSR